MARQNKTCLCCKTRYSHCPSCSRADALAPAWKSEFCSETCMILWTTLTKFGMNRLTKSDAKSIISDLDLKQMNTYAECVQRDYAKVMSEDKKLKRNKRIEIKQDQYVEFKEQMVIEPTAHEVVKKENE